jgi:hypothetical protein
MNNVGADGFLRQLPSQLQGVGIHQLLSIAVACPAGALRSGGPGGLCGRDESGDRPGGDDRRTGRQIRQRGVDGIDDSDEVDVESIGEGLNRQMSAQRADARVGDYHVEFAEFGYRVGKFAAHRHSVSHVDLGGVGLAAGLLHLQTGFFEITRCRQRIFVGLDVVTDVEEDDVGTLLGQLDGMAASLTAGTSGNQNDFVLYSARIRDHSL